jgi:hypothetical protein
MLLDATKCGLKTHLVSFQTTLGCIDDNNDDVLLFVLAETKCNKLCFFNNTASF